jgi:hypothetical protein
MKDSNQIPAIDDAEKKAWDESVLGSTLNSALNHQIDSRYRPVLIHRCIEGDTSKHPQYVAAGTSFIGKDGSLFVVTVEHLLQRNFSKDLFVFRYLCPDVPKVTFGAASIAYRNIDVGLPDDVDIVILKAGNPNFLPCFSTLLNGVDHAANVFLFDNLEVGGRIIKNLTSLVTGKIYPVIGARSKPQSILIDFASREGQSGTGFIDEHGQLYVLSGGTRMQIEISQH